MIKNILLAEDDRGTALVVKTQLEAKGYSVNTAGNGIEALKVLAIKKIDLIITDVIMPKMDGVDLYGAVKKNPATADIPIIIVTDKDVFKESFSSLGVFNFVEKTTDISNLLDRIKNIDSKANLTKEYHKILITSNHSVIISQMRTALNGMKYLISEAYTTDQIFAKAFTMIPHILVMDVLYQDQASSYEIIKAFRSFSCFKNMKIITYAFFPEDLGMDVDAVQSVENAMKQCTQAGSDVYIGRFNPSFFIEKISNLNP